MRSQTSQSKSESSKVKPSFQHQNLSSNPLDFFKERGGKVIETEHGWCNYYIMPNGLVYLDNLYINPDSRSSLNGTSLLMRFEVYIKEIEGKNTYYTTISRIFGDTNKTLLICLKRGMILDSMNAEAIFLKKEL